MGRYSSVQTYADNNAGVRKVPYEQAAARPDGGTKNKVGVQPEKVVNPYGSTAGAGSGDFHVYRHARNREMKRQDDMERSAAEQEAEDKYQRELEANRQWEEERTAKRRRKREREKNSKKRKDNLAKAGIRIGADDDDAADGEFTYTPGEAVKPLATDTADPTGTTSSKKEATLPPIDLPPNDGSFLEMIKQKLSQQQNNSSNNNKKVAEAEQDGRETAPAQKVDNV
jgi:Protein of unknown function (DUF1168)